MVKILILILSMHDDSDWVSFLAYTNLLGTKGFVAVCFFCYALIICVFVIILNLFLCIKVI
jgi:hypothetical protein